VVYESILILFSAFFSEGIALSDAPQIPNFCHQVAPQFSRNCSRNCAWSKNWRKGFAHRFT